MSNMIWVYVHWRGDMLAFNELLKSILMAAGDFLIRRRKATMRLSKWEILIA